MLTDSPETVTPPAAVGTFRFLAVPLLHPSPTNPRRHAHADADAELVASVRSLGILEPLIVRPLASPANEYPRYEIVAGHRRFAAATAAGLWEVPCVIRELTDAQALEIAVTENNQRQDVHPLDEAEAFERLIRTTGTTEEQLATRLGRPRRYVTDRLRLLKLTTSAITAFDADVITLGHALLIAKLKPEDQDQALEACFDQYLNYEDEDGEAARVLKPVHELQTHINRTIRLDLASPVFQEEFPELAKEVADASVSGATVLAITEAYNDSRKPAPPGEPIDAYWWDECQASTPGAQRGVIVQGRRRGKLLWVTIRQPAQKTAEHDPKVKKTAAEREADREEREADDKRRSEEKAAEARRDEVHARVLQSVVEHVNEAHFNNPVILGLIADGLAGAGSFDAQMLQHASKALKVDNNVFGMFSPTRRKLTAAKLRAVIAVQLLGLEWDADGDLTDVCKMFGINLKAIDKAVAKEHAAFDKRKQRDAVQSARVKAAVAKVGKKR